MESKSTKPSWWVPFLIFGMMMVALFGEALDHALLPIEPGIEMFTVMAGFALVGVWVQTNRGRLEDSDPSVYKIILIKPNSPPDESDHTRAMFDDVGETIENQAIQSIPRGERKS